MIRSVGTSARLLRPFSSVPCQRIHSISYEAVSRSRQISTSSKQRSESKMSEESDSDMQYAPGDNNDAQKNSNSLGKRIRKKKRNDDSLRAEKSLMERNRKKLLRRKSAKKSTSNGKLDKPETSSKKPVSNVALLAAKVQANQIQSVALAANSTPNSSKVLSIDAGKDPVLSPITNAEVIMKKNEGPESKGNCSKDVTQHEHEQDVDYLQHSDDEQGMDQSIPAGGSGNKDKSTANESAQSDSSSDSDDDGSRGKKPKPLKEAEYLNHLRYREGHDDCVELHPHSGIFVDEDALLALKAKTKTHTSLVRNLLEMVFTDEAVMQCSLLGGIQKGPLGKTEGSRPGLYPKALKAIMDMAKHYCKDRKIKRETRSALNRQMGTKLSEMRGRIRRELEYKRLKEEKKKAKKLKEKKD